MKYQNYFKLIFCFIIVVLSFSGLSKDNLDQKVKKLTLELRCMTCQNQSIYDSDSDYAKDIKKLVEEKFTQGLDEKEIKLFLTQRYGEYILFKPYFNRKNLILWLFPFIMVVFSIGFFIRNMKKN